MGFNLSQIVNKVLNVSIIDSFANLPAEEQNAYNWSFVVPRANNYYATGFTKKRWGQQFNSFVQLYSAAAGSYIKFPFRGRRIGVLVAKDPGHGILNFDVDGVAYPSLDLSQTDNTYYNVPYIIALDLPEGDHVLTILKSDNKGSGVQAFLVDDASDSQVFMRSAIDYHSALDEGYTVSIGTTLTAIGNPWDWWLVNAVITNTTASPITVTLKQGTSSTAIVGPFSVPANDFRQIPGPLFFKGGLNAIASATGCFISVGGQ